MKQNIRAIVRKGFPANNQRLMKKQKQVSFLCFHFETSILPRPFPWHEKGSVNGLSGVYSLYMIRSGHFSAQQKREHKLKRFVCVHL